MRALGGAGRFAAAGGGGCGCSCLKSDHRVVTDPQSGAWGGHLRRCCFDLGDMTQTLLYSSFKGFQERNTNNYNLFGDDGAFFFFGLTD